MQEFGVISGNIQLSPRKKHILVNTYRSFVQFLEVSPLCEWSVENDLKRGRLDQQSQTKWRLCPILLPRPFHAYDVIPISHHLQSFFLSVWECDKLVNRKMFNNPSSTEEGNSLGASVCQSSIIVIYTMPKIQPNKQGTREPGYCSNYIWFNSLFNSKS